MELTATATQTTKEKLLAMLGNPVTEVSSVDKPPGTNSSLYYYRGDLVLLALLLPYSIIGEN